ncbi:hypothetical protein ACFOG5_15705 [Pedobacter fastidiosus]|uniref:hypothetical protein n=1 Tax=Pedobacter fastidiosus TaxID=2765361 RepID=UPI0036156381
MFRRLNINSLQSASADCLQLNNWEALAKLVKNNPIPLVETNGNEHQGASTGFHCSLLQLTVY